MVFYSVTSQKQPPEVLYKKVALKSFIPPPRHSKTLKFPDAVNKNRNGQNGTLTWNMFKFFYKQKPANRIAIYYSLNKKEN